MTSSVSLKSLIAEHTKAGEERRQAKGLARYPSTPLRMSTAVRSEIQEHAAAGGMTMAQFLLSLFDEQRLATGRDGIAQIDPDYAKTLAASQPKVTR